MWSNLTLAHVGLFKFMINTTTDNSFLHNLWLARIVGLLSMSVDRMNFDRVTLIFQGKWSGFDFNFTFNVVKRNVTSLGPINKGAAEWAEKWKSGAGENEWTNAIILNIVTFKLDSNSWSWYVSIVYSGQNNHFKNNLYSKELKTYGIWNIWWGWDLRLHLVSKALDIVFDIDYLGKSHYHTRKITMLPRL